MRVSVIFLIKLSLIRESENLGEEVEGEAASLKIIPTFFGNNRPSARSPAGPMEFLAPSPTVASGYFCKTQVEETEDGCLCTFFLFLLFSLVKLFFFVESYNYCYKIQNRACSLGYGIKKPPTTPGK